MSECFDDWNEDPEIGDVHVLGDTTYVWDGEKWNGSATEWNYTRETYWSDVLLTEDPGTPTTDPDNWATTGTANTYWRAERERINGVWSPWTVTPIRGYDGINGTDGADGEDGADGADADTIRYAGWYNISSATGTWDYVLAASAVPNGIPVEDDVVTIWKETDVTVSVTKRYDGTAWITPGLVVHGDLLAAGTVRGDRFVAGTEIISPLITTGELVGGVIKSPTIQMVGTSYMLVQDVTPFGPDNLIEWFGPVTVDGSGEPVWASLSKATSVTSKSSTGVVYTSGEIQATSGSFVGALTGSSFNGIRLKIGSFASTEDGDELISVTSTEGKVYDASTGSSTQYDTTAAFTTLLGVSLSHMGPSTGTRDMNFPRLYDANSFIFNRDDGYDGTQYFSYIAWGI